MSNLTNDQYPSADHMAFPIQASDLCGSLYPEKGLTKRELFAAMAMQGWLAGCGNAYDEFTNKGIHADVAAESSVKFADALLTALQETPRG